MKKWVISVTVFIGSFVLLAGVGLILALVVAGPHSDILPTPLQIPAVILIWILILYIPSRLAYRTFRKYSRVEK